MKEILMISLFVFSMDADAINIEKTKQQLIKKIEKKAKKYEVVKKLDSLTNLSLGTLDIRIRPKKLTIGAKTKTESFNVETNGKDFKLNLNISF